MVWAKMNIKKYIISSKWNVFIQFYDYPFALLLPSDDN